MKTALVLGSGGFIGAHLVKRLKSEGYWVRGADIKHPEFSPSEADDFVRMDLRDPRNVEAVMRLQVGELYGSELPLPYNYLPKEFVDHKPFDQVYQLAALMGGAAYIFTGDHDADVMHDSALINLNVAAWAKIHGVKKLFYSSSACMYPQEIQRETNNVGLKETDAYPASPDSEYGWEKLFSERLYMAYARNYGLNIRIARFHNIYGPEGTYKGGKEKAPAAMCRKVIEADGTIEVFGDGLQTRSFLYIDDCIDAVRLLMESDHTEPINIGSEEMISINDLAKMVIGISGKNIKIKNIPGPVGVRGRNSDNTKLREVLNGWEPKYSLLKGMGLLYQWVKSRYE